MNDPGHMISADAAKLIAASVRFASRFSRETVNRTDAPPTLPPYTPATVAWHVKVTADPPGGSAELSTLYEGTAYMPDPGGSVAAPAWLTVTCWVRALPGQTLAVGDFALARLSGWRAADPGDSPYSARPIYELNATAVSLGCGLTRDEGGNLTLDYADIAGDGLSVDSSGDCDKLQVEPTTMVPSTGPKYGLTFIFVGGRYYLSAYIGCGLEFDANGAIAVDVAQIVGNRTITGLVVGPDFLLCPTIANDYVVDRADAQTVITSDTTTFACCTETRTQVKVTNTYYFNAANELIFWTAGAPVTTVTTVDFCAKVKCCFAVALAAAPEADPVYGEPSLAVDFVAGRSGGVGPFTYLWDFGDPGSGVLNTSSLENPSHTYTNPGRKTVTLTVTDTTCNCSVTKTLHVYVLYGTCDCPELCPAGMVRRFAFTVAGGTGDFAGANGEWAVYHTQACSYEGDRDGWFAIMSTAGSLAAVTLSGPDGQVIGFGGTAAGCCSVGTLTVATTTGTGAPPDPIDPLSSGDCGPCPVTTTCCGNTIPSALNLTLTGGTCSGSSTVFWNGTDWQGDITLTGGTGGTLHATLSCSGSTWTASFTGCDTFGGTVTGTCSPFDRSGIPSATICCGGGSMTARFFE